MSLSPLTQAQRGRPAERLLTQANNRPRRPPSKRELMMRRVMITMTKLGLPLLAIVLLSAIAFWPEIVRLEDAQRVTFRRLLAVEPESGRMLDPHYHGIDERSRPYTITAAWADQAGPNRVNLGDPKGDLVLENGQWLMVQSQEGVYIQHTGLLDLSKNVVLYRDDGTVLRSQTASADVKQGAAASNDKTHAEGPFGVLDAQGFALTDKGGAIQFQGPARMILNGANK